MSVSGIQPNQAAPVPPANAPAPAPAVDRKNDGDGDDAAASRPSLPRGQGGVVDQTA